MRYFVFLMAMLALLIGCSNPVSRSDASTAVSLETAVPIPQHTTQPTLPPPLIQPSAQPTIQPTNSPTPPPTATPPPPSISNPVDAELAEKAAAYGLDVTAVSDANSGVWQFTANSFIHPLALDVRGDTAYLLDAGRVLAINLTAPQPPAILLEPGQAIEGVRVLEPLDLAVTDSELLALDRAGDVYAYDFAAQSWRIDRYDRAPRLDSANHYYVALAGVGNGRFLLDTNYNYVKRYAAAEGDAGWLLPDSRGVDVAVQGENVYVLLREMDSRAGLLNAYQHTASRPAFRPNISIEQPRQVAATETAVYVLDQAGERILVLQPQTGALQAVIQSPPETSAMWAGDGRLILAGRDALYFVNEPGRRDWVESTAMLVGPQPHDPALFAALPPLRLPIGITLPQRDLQLPGAPRHYRLGVHQGIDLYWRRGAEVTAVADGTVVRATLDYTDPDTYDFAAWDSETQSLGYTSDAALDFYRGRQVWVQHEGGLLSRYAHLESVAGGVVTGTAVIQGQLLGTVGNSGTPSSLLTGKPDTHIHFDLWLGDHYIGQYLRPVETREWLEQILGIDE
ncbi:MAG: M23 family metallopeptidase [Ardenticatenaceae bacterium]|nr:M23 family metallopeptidase [Anaerolineales bacterium]MCB8921731.1 M23 family metallopeptidase [Ardenticatenaceae bacterium]